MDEVLPHAIMHGKDEKLFKENAIPYSVANGNSEQQASLI